MVIKRKRAITAVALAMFLGTGVCAIKSFIERNRAIAVFNDTGDEYVKLLQEGLPDESGEERGVKDIIRSIIGFDMREPHTVIESSSSVFDNVEIAAAIHEEISGNVPETIAEGTQEIAPDPEDKPVLPAFSQICTSTGIAMSNATDYTVDPDAMCAEPLYIKPSDEGPQVLILHTHTTECYDGDNLVGESDRTTDETKNMIAVGTAMKSVLEEYGIECIHDTTVHDYPTYQGAYTRELSTVEKNLAQNPSIKLVLDIHRDAFIYPDGSKLKLECDVNGISTAKVMIVCGTDAMGLSNPDWRENFKLAAKIQNAAQIMYPGMMRPINLRKERFNMHTTTGSLLFEIGANGNTLPQAIEAGKNTARAIAAVLINQA